MKNYTFKRIVKLNEFELKELKKHSKTLSPKLHKFIGNLIKRFNVWNKINDNTNEDKFIEQSHVYSTKYFANYAKSMVKVKQFFTDFLVINEVNEDEVLKEKILFKSAQRKNYSDGYFYHLQEWEKTSNLQVERSFNYEYDMYRVNYYRFFHPAFQKSKLKTRHSSVDYIPEKVLSNSWEHLRLFTLIAQIRLACEIEYQKLKLSDRKDYLDNLEDLDIKLVEKHSDENIVLYIYYNIYKWLKVRDFYDFKTFETVVPITIENIQLFSEEEQVSVLMIIYNCIGRMMRYTQNSERLLKMNADIGLEGFRHNIFGKRLDLDLNFFLGFYDILSRTYPESISILYDNIDKLSTSNDKFWARTYINAHKLMKEGDFGNAINDLNQLNHFRNYTLITRKFVLLLKCTYELKLTIHDESNNYHKRITSFETWLNIVKAVDKSLNNSEYMQKISRENEHIALYNFIEIVSAIYLQTYTMHEIDYMIRNKATYGVPWLKAKLKNYSQCPKSELGNKLKTYKKVRDLLP
ncbi:MAG: hypothetical protein AB8G11_06140 [Saprospiraceae bacterium]